MTVRGAFSLHFTYEPDDAKTILLLTDITGIASYLEEDTGYGDLDILIGTSTSGGKRFIEISTLLDDVVVDKSDMQISDSAVVPELDIWVYVYDTALSVYCNGKWVYSYVMAFTQYVGYITTASLKAQGGSITITDIRREEIPDWRDAVYVDYESTGDNALQSIYQQRPVRVFPHVDRKISFTYHAVKDQVNAIKVKRFHDRVAGSQDISSDGLVYFYEVGISTNADVAKEVGLITRLYRLSELDIGGVEAAATIQKIAFEQMTPVDAEQRLDPRLEVSDRAIYDLVTSGTLMHIQDDMIVEDISIAIEDGRYTMSVSGRRNSDGTTLFTHS